MSEEQQLEDLIREFNCSTGVDPILFIPHLEEINPISYFDNNQFPNGQPQVVFKDEYDETSGTVPGYIVINSQFSVISENIEEEYAWMNDVWVFGIEEQVSQQNTVAAVNDTRTLITDELPDWDEIQRAQGHYEYSGILQVASNVSLRNIEPWVHGKLEFRETIYDSGGNLITNAYMGKWRRKNFKDAKWKDFGINVGYWWLTTWGPKQLETWIEEDGGSQTNTISTNFNPGSGYPSIIITQQIKTDDDNLGSSTVQFNDFALPEPQVTTYTLGLVNFRRRTEQ